MGKRVYLQLGTLLTLTVLFNLTLFYWSAQVVEKSHALDTNWQQNTANTIEKASLLAQLERSMGYGGFIHNFKNFILRGEQIYFIRAQQDLSNVYRSIDSFSQFELSAKESQSLAIISKTVDQYAAKLLNENIQNKSRDNIAQIDKAVKVDDTQAEQALDALRTSLRDSYQRTLTDQARLTEDMNIFIKLGAYFLSPIVCLVALLNMLMLWYMQQLLKERSALMEVMSDTVIYYDKDGRIWQVNEVGKKQFGYSKKELAKMTMADLMPNHFHGATFLKQVKHSFNHPLLVDTERDTCVVAVHKNGTKKRYKLTVSVILNGDRQFYIAVMHDLSEEQALLEKAHLDYLTGVYNRRQAYSLLETELARLNRYHRPLAILLVDLDNFKPLNDKEGHLAGDIALKELCVFLKESARPTDIIGRWGGDEFILVCPETGHHSAMSFARRLVDEYAQQAKNNLTLSIGVVAYDFITDKLCADECVEQADKALYKAKSYGRNQAVIYQPELFGIQSSS